MKHISTLILLAVVVTMVAWAAAPAPVSAQCTGLVPCGCDADNQCEFEDLITLINRIITWLIQFALAFAAILFAYAGWLYMSAQGDMNKVSQAHSIFKNVALGLVLALAAWLVIYLIASTLTDDGEILQYFE